MNLLKQKPYYTRIALLGIAMYLCIEVVILIINLIFAPSWWLYSVVIGGIFGAIGAAIYFVRPWGLIVGVLGSSRVRERRHRRQSLLAGLVLRLRVPPGH